MSTETADEDKPEETVEKHGALIKGLDSENPDRISSAAYICSKLNGLPRLEDDFEFNRGHGVSSEALLYSLTFLLPEASAKDYEEFDEYVERGQALSEYDDLVDIALYLYKQEHEDRQMTRAWERVLSELEERSDRIEEEIEELRDEVGES